MSLPFNNNNKARYSFANRQEKKIMWDSF